MCAWTFLHNLLSPAGLRVMERASAVLGLVVSSVVSWYTVAVMFDAHGIGAQVMKSLVFPEWWLFLPLLGSFVLIAVECLRRLLGGVVHDGGAEAAAKA